MLFVTAVTETDVSVQGTLFKAGSISELRIKTASDFRAMNSKTLRLVVGSKPIEFGIKNVTRTAYKGTNNQTIFNALNEVLNVNEEAMRILELLQEEITEEQIVAQLLKEYSGDKEEIAPLVNAYICQLRQEGLLEE